ISTDVDDIDDSAVVLQWGRASSARISRNVANPKQLLAASMGPGFVSPDFLRRQRPVALSRSASMGPGFVSPDFTPGLRVPISTLGLQWGRASSARISRWRQYDGGVRGRFNGAGLRQPGFPAGNELVKQRRRASMGPGFVSPDFM